MTFWYTFWLWVASFVITDYFRQKLPAQTPSGLGDFSIPTATEGRFVPLMFGTMVIQGPNVVWYGDFVARERTVSTGIIFKRSETIGFTYELAMQLGLVRGVTAGIRRIWIGDDVVWDYTVDNGSVPGLVCDVTKEDLFGGPDQGGGFTGRFRLFNGLPSQGFSAYLQTQGITNLPAYRGYSHVVLTNQAEDGGADIGEANIVRNFKFELQMFDTVANGGLGDVLGLGNDHHIIGDDINPISLAYESYTNTDWGRGLSPSDLNLANFQTSAETIFNEGLGFSALIDQVQTSGDLIDTIEQHVDAYIGPNPITGQIEITLARQDYTLASEFQADETNVISVTKFSRGENNQTFNEILVQYTDRAKDYGDTYAPAQDLANLIIQGRPRSKTVRYTGVHAASVANKIVWRDIRGLSRALASATVEINRTAWGLRPGNIMSLTDDEVDVTNMPFRIIAIRQGDPIAASVIADVVEDIFGVEFVGFSDPPESEFVPPTQAVNPFLLADMLAMEAPFIINQQDPDTPSVFPRMFVGARDGGVGLMSKFDVKDRTRTPPSGFSGGYTLIDDVGGGTMVVGTLRDAQTGWQTGNGGFTMDIDAITGELDALIDTYAPGGVGQMAGVAVINPNTATEEWIAFTGIIDLSVSPEATGGIRLTGVYRACMDSGMQIHGAGERIWFIWTGGTALPDKQYTVADAIDPKFLPKSQTDAISETDSPEPVSAAEVILDDDARYLKPLLPIAMDFDGVDFSTTGDFDAVAPGSPVAQGVTITPTHRSFRTKDVIWSVTGLDMDGLTMGADDIEDDAVFSWYLFDLDVTPAPIRGTDEIDSGIDVPLTSPTQPFTMSKSVIAGSRTNNSFNARLEFLMRHNPSGFAALSPGRETREVMQFDFTAIGTFIVPADAAFLHLQFNGEDASATFLDSTANRHVVRTLGPAEIDTAQKVFGTGSGFFDFNGGGWNNVPGGLQIDSEGAISGLWNPNDDHTIEFRVRFSQVLGSNDKQIVGQWSLSGIGNVSWRWWMDMDAFGDVQFEFWTSTNGTSTTGTQSVGSVWSPSPNLNAWYAITLVKKSLPGGQLLLDAFVDGASLGSVQITDPVIATISPELPIDLFLSDYDRSPIDGGPSNGIDGWIDEFRMVKGFALNLIDFTPETSEFDATRGEVIFQSDFNGIPGVNVGEGTDPHQELWQFNGAPGDVEFSFNTAITGLASLKCIGGFEDGLEVGTSTVTHQQFGSEDFTLEGFIRFNTLPSTKSDGMFLCGNWTSTANGREWGFGFDENNDLNFIGFWPTGQVGDAKEATVETGLSPKLEIDTWYHIAATRNGTELNIYFNGTRVLQDTAFFIDQTSSPGALAFLGGPAQHFSNLCIAKAAEDEAVVDRSRSLDGYVDHVRIIKGRALETGATFTIPSPVEFWDNEEIDSTNPRRDLDGFPSFENTTFHIHFDDEDRQSTSPEGTDATDYGANPTSNLTFFNSAVIVQTSPVPPFGGSALQCGGSPQGYVTTLDSFEDVQEIGGLDDFTLECVVMFNGDPGTAKMTFMARWNSSGAFRSWYFQLNNNNLEFHYSDDFVADKSRGAPWNPVGGIWYHVACTRVQGIMHFFIDGTELTTSPEQMLNIDAISVARVDYAIGTHFIASVPTDVFQGWIREVRVIGNHGLWDASFTAPTKEYSFHRTIIHARPDDERDRYAQPGDISRFSTVYETDGANGADASNEIVKFGPNAFDLTGTVSYLTWTPQNGVHWFEDKEFTIEGWVYFTTDPQSGSNQSFAGHWQVTGAESWIWRCNPSSTSVEFVWTTDGSTDKFASWPFTSPRMFETGQWYHVALVRDNSVSPEVMRFFIDGVEQAAGSPDNVIGGDTLFDSSGTATWEVCIGAGQPAIDEIRGYLEEWRMVKGVNIYLEANTNSPVGTFAIPTTRFQRIDIP